MSIMQLSPTAEENLRRLSHYLKNLPSEGLGFDMGTYYTRPNYHRREPCPAVACAIGHYAVMEGWKAEGGGAVPPPKIAAKVLGEGETCMPWVPFANTIIGVPYRKGDRHIGDWVFGSDWADVDNTTIGAAARIDYLLEHGVPEAFIVSNSANKYNESMVALYADTREALEVQNP